MIAALLWLTVSAPFVYQAQQAQLEHQQTESDGSLLNNTTEEKNESSVNTLSEFLHHIQLPYASTFILKKSYKCFPSDLYFEFHPQLISPPPEAQV